MLKVTVKGVKRRLWLIRLQKLLRRQAVGWYVVWQLPNRALDPPAHVAHDAQAT
jgi:hypothetical protein